MLNTEVETGMKLGSGEFGVVLEVVAFDIQQEHVRDAALSRRGLDLVIPQDEPACSSPPRSILIQRPSSQEEAPDAVSTGFSATATHQRKDSRVLFAEDFVAGEKSDSTTEDTTPAGEMHSNFCDDVSSYGEDELSFKFSDRNKRCGEDSFVERVREQHDMLRAHCSGKLFRDGMPRFALKRVKDGVTEPQANLNATIDLACEARFLQSISHSNVIRLRATIGEPGTRSFGLLLDRLSITLDKKIEQWREEHKRRNGGIAPLLGVFHRKEREAQEKRLYNDRLLVALDIARALRHLHSKRIIYRDLKPENIGFNVRGHVQIFDFGLAREVCTDTSFPPSFCQIFAVPLTNSFVVHVFSAAQSQGPCRRWRRLRCNRAHGIAKIHGP